jgi:hypothetical protein
VKGKYAFQLCATFTKETPEGVAIENFSQPQPVGAYKNGFEENWKHTAGKVCFDRTIDPELYPPYSTMTKGAPVIMR